MTTRQFRVSEAASLLGVSDDTIRRWADAGRLTLTRVPNGRMVVDGVELAAVAQELAREREPDPPARARASVRNHFRGIVTRVVKDTVMAQVELQAGPYRVVSLISREAADELGLEVGVVAVAGAKATNVSIELVEER